MRDALREIRSISAVSDAEPIRSVRKAAGEAEALANRLIKRLARGAARDASGAGLAWQLSEATAAIEESIRDHRYEFELSELLRQAAAARSLAHSVQIRIDRVVYH